MKPLRHTLKIVTTVAVTLTPARGFSSISFALRATSALVRFAAFFGAYGDEHVADNYLLTSVALSLLLAAIIVRGANRLLRRSL
jgi:hypothetical protein